MSYIDLPCNGHTFRIHCRPPRKGNRRLRLSIDAGGKVHLSYPVRISRAEIAAFIRQHAEWIAARAVPLDMQRAHNPYAEGSTHYLLGEAHILQFDGRQTRLTAENGILRTSSADADTLAARFKTLHRAMSEAHIPALVHGQLPHCPWVRELPPIRYRAMRKTWGTCRSDGVLTFNTRLIQYPAPLIEHVIIHELCHLKEHNHSPAFYALMDIAQPDWRARRSALDAFARILPAP
ncbi:MAG: SprT family zinc-dependent metalloprotease [Cardiobacteriaceae bacterium]|nr:SprT family zinc-dependent metalloprotease [Cardiobacteriaceae bacterium]